MTAPGRREWLDGGFTVVDPSAATPWGGEQSMDTEVGVPSITKVVTASRVPGAKSTSPVPGPVCQVTGLKLVLYVIRGIEGQGGVALGQVGGRCRFLVRAHRTARCSLLRSGRPRSPTAS